MKYVQINALNAAQVMDDIALNINSAITYTDGKKEWARLPMHFDTETSNYEVGDRKFAFVYISQMGVGKTPFYCRDFNTMLDMIMGIVSNLLVNVRMGIHNTGFDWSFMVNYIMENAGAYGLKIDALLNKPHSPITITITNERGFIMQIVDTALIFNMSLESVGKKYTTSKKQVGKLDYDKVRHSLTPLDADEMDYCMFDVIVGCEAMEYIYTNFTDKGKPFPCTSTGMVRQNLKENYKAMIKDDKDFLTYAPVDRKGNVDFAKYFPHDYETYKAHFMDYLFRGGFTHGNISYMGEVVENVTCNDYTSSYPAVMFQKSFPLTPFHKIGSVSYNQYTDGKEIFATIGNQRYEIWNTVSNHYIMEVTFHNLRATTFHSLESQSKAINFKGLSEREIERIASIDNGRIFAADEVRVMLTELDYHNYTRAYSWDSVEIHYLAVAQGGRLPKYLIETMTQPYITKAQLKKLKQAYDAEKALVNSTYGMCVQRLNLTSYILGLDEDGNVDTSEADYAQKIKEKCWPEISTNIMAYNSNNGTSYTVDDYKMNPTLRDMADKVQEKKAYQIQAGTRILNPYWGLYISAHARHNLVQCMFDLEEVNPNCVVYYDTDSLYIKDVEKVQHVIDAYNEEMLRVNQSLTDAEELWDLGQFESDPVCLKFKHLGAKRYVKYGYFDKDNPDKAVVKSTIAGLKKNYFGKYEADEAFEKFNHGFVVDKILTGKMSSEYFNDHLFIPVTDYMKETTMVEINGGVCLSPAPFSLFIASTYQELAHQLKK